MRYWNLRTRRWRRLYAYCCGADPFFFLSIVRYDGKEGLPRHKSVQILTVHASRPGEEALDIGDDDSDDGAM
jgi:hypothetical protein